MSTVSDVEASAILASSEWDRMEAACKAAEAAHAALEKAEATYAKRKNSLNRILRDIAQVAFDRACRRCETHQSKAA